MNETELKEAMEHITEALNRNTEATNKMYITMFGVEGEGGCVRHHNILSKDFYAFRRLTLIVLAFTAGGSGFGLARLLGG